MISVVVPIYNEEELISQFHIAVAEAMKSTGEHWEVVYVNDGSRDSSLELLKGLQTVDSHVVVVDLSRNWGHMGAISAGLQTARGDAVVLMDGDFQDPPEVVPELVEAWKGGAQVVVAVRRSRKERRKILAKLFPLFTGCSVLFLTTPSRSTLESSVLWTGRQSTQSMLCAKTIAICRDCAHG